MATEFVSKINKTGEDYGSVSSWESAIQSDLTSAATKVFSHSGITGTISDGASVTGLTSGATGTATHATTTQIMIKTITGTFQAGEVVFQTISVNLVTISDAGDSVIAVGECYDDDGVLTDPCGVGGWTTSATNYVKLTVPVGDRHNGTVASGFKLQRTSGTSEVININQSYTVIEWFIITGTITTSSSFNLIHCNTGPTGIIIRNCILYNALNTGGGVFSGLGGSSSGLNVLNCIAYGNEGNGIGQAISSQTHNFFNCTAYGNGSNGFGGGNGTQVCKNCLAIGNATDYGAIDTIITSGSGDTTGTTDNLVAATEFVDPTGGTPNFHLKSGALSIDAGTDLGTTDNVNIDIDNQTRSGTWDFGADEYVASGTDVTVSPTALSIVASFQTARCTVWAPIFYNRFKTNLLKGLFDANASGSHIIKVALLADTYTFNPDHNYFTTISSHEISGTNYTAGGTTLSNFSVTQDNTEDWGRFDADDATWNTSTITARYAVAYDNTLTTKDLIFCIDFQQNKVTVGGTFSIVWNSVGLIASA